MRRRADGLVRVAARDAVTPAQPLVVSVGRYEVAIFDLDGALYAYENACPHQGGPIGEGWIEGATVICPWHAWRFDLRTGAMTLGDFARLRRFTVKVEGGEILLGNEPEEA